MLQYVNPVKALDEMIRVSSRYVYVIVPNRNNPIFRLHRATTRFSSARTGEGYLAPKVFRKMVLERTGVNKVHFRTREAHYYPLSRKLIYLMFMLLEDLFEKAPFVQDLKSHIIAIIEKIDQGQRFCPRRLSAPKSSAYLRAVSCRR